MPLNDESHKLLHERIEAWQNSSRLINGGDTMVNNRRRYRCNSCFFHRKVPLAPLSNVPQSHVTMPKYKVSTPWSRW